MAPDTTRAKEDGYPEWRVAGLPVEVVSQLLKKLEQQECIVLKRGKILLGKNKQMSGSI